MSTLIKRSLVGGELSPALYSRVDLARYATGLRTLRNCFVKKGGGATNRAGTFYVYGAGETIGAEAFPIPFEATGSADSYVLEFGNGFIRFTKNGELIRVSGVSAWADATAYAIADLVTHGGVNYYCILAHTSGTGVIEPPNATYWHPLTEDVYSVPTPWTTDFVAAGLSYVQRTDRMSIVSRKNTSGNELKPYDLRRVSDTKWTLSQWGFAGTNAFGDPTIGTPTSLAASVAGTAAAWVVTALTREGDESYPSTRATGALPTSGAPQTLTWTAPTFVPPFTGTISGYHIYREIYGVNYFIGFSPTNSFIDNGFFVPQVDADTPPEKRSEIAGALNTPSCVGAYQQRTMIAGMTLDAQSGYASKIGLDQNFTKRFSPTRADDSLRFQLRGKGVNGIQNMVDIGPLVLFSEGGEWVIPTDPSGFTQATANPRQYGHNGSSSLIPIVVGDDIIYLQRDGSVIRALGFDNNTGGFDGFRDDDLTAFAEHLFEGHQIVSWCYQKTPDSVLWAVRDDGVMVGLTYIKAQQILALHRHDTDGFVEKVCSVPEGLEHAVYMIVRRVIDGSTVRYMERMYSRNFTDIKEAVFMDSSLSYDGRNTGSTTMTLSGGTDWTYEETLTLTASASFFAAGDVGNEIHLTAADGSAIRASITEYTSGTVVSVSVDKTVPVDLRTTATTDWAKAVDGLAGLEHLEGKEVSVFGDGYVVASPNNSDYPIITVASGEIELDRCYSVIHAGLPYLSDIETLDIDTVDGETLIDKKKYVNTVALHVQKTRSLWIGPESPEDDPLQNMQELKIRDDEDWEEQTRLRTEVVEQVIPGSWSKGGRVFLRQVDPEPMTILSIAPQGLFPFKGGR